MLISVSTDIAKHLGARGLEGRMELLDRIAKIIPVASGIADAEDRNWLATQIHAADLLQVVVPASARALLVGTSVPSGRPYNEAIEAGQVRSTRIGNILGLAARLRRDRARNILGLAGLCAKEKANRPHANQSATAPILHTILDRRAHRVLKSLFGDRGAWL